MALAIASDFATGVSTMAIVPATYLLCSRRNDVRIKNPFILQFMFFLFLCGFVHICSISIIQSKISSVLVGLKFLCALFSVTSVGSIYLFLEKIAKIPSVISYNNLGNEVTLLKRKFQQIECSEFLNRLKIIDSEEEISVVIVQELAKILPCDIIGSYIVCQSSNNNQEDINDLNEENNNTSPNVPTSPRLSMDNDYNSNNKDKSLFNSTLAVSSSSRLYELPRNLPLQELEVHENIIVIKKINGERLLGNMIQFQNIESTNVAYETENVVEHKVSIPVTLENELLSLPFNYYIIITCSFYSPNYFNRNDFLLCFTQPIYLNHEKLILLKQCVAASQLAYFRLQQINYLSSATKIFEKENQKIANEKNRNKKELVLKSDLISQISLDMKNELLNLQNSLSLLLKDKQQQKALSTSSNTTEKPKELSNSNIEKLEIKNNLSEDINKLTNFLNDIIDFIKNSYPNNLKQKNKTKLNYYLNGNENFELTSNDIWDFHNEISIIWKNINDNIAPKFNVKTHLAAIPSDVPKFVIGDYSLFRKCIFVLLSFSMEIIGKGSNVLVSVKCSSFNNKVNHDSFHKKFNFDKKIRYIDDIMIQIDFVASGSKGFSCHEIKKMFHPLYKSNASSSLLNSYSLQLAMIKQSIKQIGGKLIIESSINTGSIISINLPFIAADIISSKATDERNLSSPANSPKILHRDKQSDAISTSTQNFIDNNIINNATKLNSHVVKLHNSDDRINKINSDKSSKTKNLPTVLDTENLRILIAEDNLLNQKVIVRLLGKLGHKDVTMVTQGDLAVSAVQDADPPFDLIFMDLHMPVMGGIEACKLIREMELEKYPKIIACTANAQNDVKSQFEKFGAYAFIPKPINFKKLSAALDDYKNQL